MVEKSLRTWILVRREGNIKVGCEDRRWMKVIFDHVWWRALLLIVLNLSVLLLQG
jgi:hypothetical protein